MKMPSGRYKGIDITRLPDRYIWWLYSRPTVNNGNLKQHILNEIARRRQKDKRKRKKEKGEQQMIMPFGPYKGTDTKLLPEQYIVDLHQWPQLAGALKRCIQEEIARRRLTVDSNVVAANPDYQPPDEITGYDLALTEVRDFRSKHVE